tara:strand:- start:439 stop:714 length:276 start_codon:yes stop_codon:yes gene_type:complete
MEQVVMALVKTATLRLVGVVDVLEMIDELASSTPGDIVDFCTTIVARHFEMQGTENIEKIVAQKILDMDLITYELKEEGEEEGVEDDATKL